MFSKKYKTYYFFLIAITDLIIKKNPECGEKWKIFLKENVLDQITKNQSQTSEFRDLIDKDNFCSTIAGIFAFEVELSPEDKIDKLKEFFNSFFSDDINSSVTSETTIENIKKILFYLLSIESDVKLIPNFPDKLTHENLEIDLKDFTSSRRGKAFLYIITQLPIIETKLTTANLLNLNCCLVEISNRLYQKLMVGGLIYELLSLRDLQQKLLKQCFTSTDKNQ